MQLLITKKFVENVRDPADTIFHPNACLYRFIDDLIEEELSATKPIQRASSLTDLKALAKSESFVKEVNKMSKIRRSNSVANLTQSVCDLSIEKPKLIKMIPLDPEIEYERHRKGSPKVPQLDSYMDRDDFMLAWKHILLKMVQLPSICDKLSANVDSEAIKWNCTQIGTSRIVKCPRAMDDLSDEVKRDFKTLQNWPCDNEDNTPLKTIVNRLCCNMRLLAPIVPYPFSSKIALLWKHFHRNFTPEELEQHQITSINISCSTLASIDSPGFKYIDEGSEFSSSRNRRNHNRLLDPYTGKDLFSFHSL